MGLLASLHNIKNSYGGVLLLLKLQTVRLQLYLKQPFSAGFLDTF